MVALTSVKCRANLLLICNVDGKWMQILCWQRSALLADVMHEIICRLLVMSVLLMPRARSAAESVSTKTGTVCKKLIVAV
jgi:hypothetical protein